MLRARACARELTLSGSAARSALVATLAAGSAGGPAIENRPGSSPYLQDLVADGKLGFKSGEGFRKWSPEQQAALRSKVMKHLKAMRDT